jgi:hypothetical protein
VPRPFTVDAKLLGATPPGPKAVLKEDIAVFRVAVDTYPRVPRPIVVELIGPPKVCPLIEETLIFKVLILERPEKEERYPAVPRPCTVDAKL